MEDALIPVPCYHQQLRDISAVYILPSEVKEPGKIKIRRFVGQDPMPPLRPARHDSGHAQLVRAWEDPPPVRAQGDRQILGIREPDRHYLRPPIPKRQFGQHQVYRVRHGGPRLLRG